MSKLGLQMDQVVEDKNVATMQASGSSSGSYAKYGRLQFVERSFKHGGWLSKTLGMITLFVTTVVSYCYTKIK